MEALPLFTTLPSPLFTPLPSPCSPLSRRPCSPLLSVTVHVAGQTASRDVGYMEALPLFTPLPSPLFTPLPSPCSPLSRRPCSPLLSVTVHVAGQTASRDVGYVEALPLFTPLLSPLFTPPVCDSARGGADSQPGRRLCGGPAPVHHSPVAPVHPSPVTLFTPLPSPLFTPPVCDSARGGADSQPGRRLRGGPAPVHHSPVAPVHPSPVAPAHPSCL